MATERRNRLPSSWRTTIKNVIRLIPAVVIIAAMLNTVSCKTNNGLFPQVHGGGGGGKTPTATPTAGTGALAFVTNFNDGKVSSFKRNTTTGALTLTKPQVTAGAKKGPRGVIAAPSGSFLYVANIKDDNIYEFSVNSTNGTLTPLSPPSVSNGNNTGPDELAMNSSGSLLWVTGSKGTVASYTVNTSTGQITKTSSIGGFNTPFGIAVLPSTTVSVLYVSDTATGLIQPMSYNTNTGALAKNFTAMHSSDVNANTPAAIAIDATGASLFIADQKLGEISTFSIDGTGAIAQGPTFQNSSPSDVPVGVGIAVNTGVEYLLTANQGGGSVSSFIVNGGTNVITPPVLAAPYNGPTGLVVDPQMVNVYTADNKDGTVAQSVIKGTCAASQICVGPTVSTENTANPNSGPFGITLAP
jgi:6-phosphogluconolactonase (cycloisomerase 2 family)